MKVLIACEESQRVCIAFRNKGHEAYSCDIQPCSGGHPEWHIQGDAIKEAYSGQYDMMIGHPPCTYLSYAGTRHWNNPGRLEKRLEALQFFAKLWLAPINKICLENPKGCASPTITKYTQMIQPYYWGHNESKATYLYLKNLPPLLYAEEDNLFMKKTFFDGEIITTNDPRSFYQKDRANHSKARSKTFQCIADTMADQWG